MFYKKTMEDYINLLIIRYLYSNYDSYVILVIESNFEAFSTGPRTEKTSKKTPRYFEFYNKF